MSQAASLGGTEGQRGCHFQTWSQGQECSRQTNRDPGFPNHLSAGHLRRWPWGVADHSSTAPSGPQAPGWGGGGGGPTQGAPSLSGCAGSQQPGGHEDTKLIGQSGTAGGGGVAGKPVISRAPSGAALTAGPPPTHVTTLSTPSCHKDGTFRLERCPQAPA